MKKLYSILLAIPMFVATANAQMLDGSNCSQAKEIPTIPDSCAVNEHQMNAGDYEQWHHVKPTQSENAL